MINTFSGPVHQDLIYSVCCNGASDLSKTFSFKIAWRCHNLPCNYRAVILLLLNCCLELFTALTFPFSPLFVKSECITIWRVSLWRDASVPSYEDRWRYFSVQSKKCSCSGGTRIIGKLMASVCHYTYKRLLVQRQVVFYSCGRWNASHYSTKLQ
jgi:hypothetical protein